MLGPPQSLAVPAAYDTFGRICFKLALVDLGREWNLCSPNSMPDGRKLRSDSKQGWTVGRSKEVRGKASTGWP